MCNIISIGFEYMYNNVKAELPVIMIVTAIHNYIIDIIIINISRWSLLLAIMDGDSGVGMSSGMKEKKDDNAEAEFYNDYDKLGLDEVMVDPIGDETMSIGREHYAKIKPLKVGDFVVVHCVGITDDNEDYWVGRLVDFDRKAEENEAKVWWFSHPRNGQRTAEKRCYYAGKLAKAAHSDTKMNVTYVPPGSELFSASLRYTLDVHKESIIYWADDILTNNGRLRVKHISRINSRMQIVRDTYQA